jgi:hypothetical protein
LATVCVATISHLYFEAALHKTGLPPHAWKAELYINDTALPHDSGQKSC